jgi:hypothetical protein
VVALVLGLTSHRNRQERKEQKAGTGTMHENFR